MHVMVYRYKNKRHEHIAVEHVVAAWAPFLLDASNANEKLRHHRKAHVISGTHVQAV